MSRKRNPMKFQRPAPKAAAPTNSTSTEAMIGGMLGSFGQLSAAALVRTQLERIADAVELGLLDSLYQSVGGATDSERELVRNRIVGARDFLRSKVLARVEAARADAERHATERIAAATP